jgi:hypothetical protein
MKIQYEILLVSLKAYQRFCLKLTTILLVIIYSSSPNYLLAQKIADTNPDKKEVVKKPVKHTFENIMLINNQTVETPKKNSLHFGIQHRFGRIDQGFKDGNNFDLFGLLGVANVRIGLVYGITNRLSIGLGATKKNYVYDLRWKYKILQQTSSKGMPVTLSYFGNVAAATIKSDNYSSFSNRLSYFNQLTIARKINKTLSLQLSGTLSYFNLIDTLGGKDVKHINYGIGLGGRINVSPSGSVIFEFNQPLTISDYGNDNKTKPGVGIGYEIATRGHVFQLFVTNAINLVDQYNMVENTNDFFNGEIFIGFNISRSWNF